MHPSRHSNSLQRVRAYYRAARSAALYYVVKPPSAKFSKFDALLLRLWCMDSSENLCAYETIHYACCVKILRECVEVARNTVTKCLFLGKVQEFQNFDQFDLSHLYMNWSEFLCGCIPRVYLSFALHFKRKLLLFSQCKIVDPTFLQNVVWFFVNSSSRCDSTKSF